MGVSTLVSYELHERCMMTYHHSFTLERPGELLLKPRFGSSISSNQVVRTEATELITHANSAEVVHGVAGTPCSSANVAGRAKTSPSCCAQKLHASMLPDLIFQDMHMLGSAR